MRNSLPIYNGHFPQHPERQEREFRRNWQGMEDFWKGFSGRSVLGREHDGDTVGSMCPIVWKTVPMTSR